MAEHLFTIFEGPDKGTQFALKSAPLGLGRDPAREIHLHDERASRFHATIACDGENVLLVDQNSANGTLVNGVLVDQCLLKEGDIITLADTPEPPGRYHPPEGFHTLPTRIAADGALGSTRIVGSRSPKTSTREESRPLDVLEAVAEAAAPLAEPLGIHLSVEADTDHAHSVLVNHHSLYRHLAALLATLLKNASPCEGTLALRLSHDQPVGRSQIEIIACAVPVNRPQLQAETAKGSFRDLWSALHAEGCILILLPVDSSDILARIYLPELNTGD